MSITFIAKTLCFREKKGLQKNTSMDATVVNCCNEISFVIFYFQSKNFKILYFSTLFCIWAPKTYKVYSFDQVPAYQGVFTNVDGTVEIQLDETNNAVDIIYNLKGVNPDCNGKHLLICIMLWTNI